MNNRTKSIDFNEDKLEREYSVNMLLKFLYMVAISEGTIQSRIYEAVKYAQFFSHTFPESLLKEVEGLNDMWNSIRKRATPRINKASRDECKLFIADITTCLTVLNDYVSKTNVLDRMVEFS